MPDMNVFTLFAVLCVIAFLGMLWDDGRRYPGPHPECEDEPAPLWRLPAWLRSAVDDPSKPLTLPHNPIEAAHLIEGLGAAIDQGD